MSSDSLSKLKKSYIILIATIAILLIITQTVVQFIVSEQENDALVINVAGRQRMLSQKITKLSIAQQYNLKEYNATDLIEIQKLFNQSSNDLSKDKYDINSAIVDSLFESISREINIISGKSQNATLQELIEAEKRFLPVMDRIVGEYQSISEEKLDYLTITELLLFLASMTVLVIEVKYLFIPLFQNAKKSNEDLENYAQALQKANTFKDGLISNLGYQYKSSIHAILNFSELLKDEGENIPRYQYIKYIQENSYRLEMILSGIEYINKFTPDRNFPKNQTINIYSLLQDSYVNWHPDIINKIDKELTIISNLELLSVIVKNVFDNAIKFSPENQIIVESSIEGNEILLKFRDHGSGIGQNFLPLVYDAFSKENNEQTELNQGMGLGLTITKQACEILGYEISIESEKDKGTTVTISIPTSALKSEHKNGKKLLTTSFFSF